MPLKLLISLALLLSVSACCQPVTQQQMEQRANSSLETFLNALAAGDTQTAYQRIDGISKREGDAELNFGPLTEAVLDKELEARNGAIANFKLGEIQWESDTRIRVDVEFPNGDRDSALLVSRTGQWWIANPIHLIR